MRKSSLLAIALFLTFGACIGAPRAAAPGNPGGKETRRFCVVLQFMQAGGGKGFHLLIKGSQGFYRLYQKGTDGYGLARNEQKGGGQPQMQELGGFAAKTAPDVWHNILFETAGGKIRIFFDGRIALAAADPAPLPAAAAELAVISPGAKPAAPETGDPTVPRYSIFFYAIEDMAAVVTNLNREDNAPIPMFEAYFEGGQVQVPDRWRLVTDDLTGSQVLTTAAKGNEAAYTGLDLPLDDFIWDLQVRLVKSHANLYCRVSAKNSYGLRIQQDRLVLWTERSGKPEDLAAANAAIGGAWHQYRITAAGRKIEVMVDGKPAFSFTDGPAAALAGGIAIEAFGDDGARFDNVKCLKIVNPQNAI